MIDYKIKAHVIGCGLVSDVSKVQRTFFKTGYGIPLSRFDYTLTQAEALYKSYNDTAIGSAHQFARPYGYHNRAQSHANRYG